MARPRHALILLMQRSTVLRSLFGFALLAVPCPVGLLRNHGVDAAFAQVGPVEREE
jgi:hypothetical protein